MILSAQFSGVLVNQNATATDLLGEFGEFPSLTLFPSPVLYPEDFAISSGSYQTFTLPFDYVRGSTDLITPQLTGFALFVAVADPTVASFGWQFDWNRNGTWVTLASGTQTAFAFTGDLWSTVLFDAPITAPDLTATYRIKITSYAQLQFNGTSPNPLSSGAVYGAADDLEPFESTGTTGSLNFRILATTADSGVDFLGNVYRSVAVTAEAASVAPISPTDVNAVWISAPCPSYFGVEAMYFDMRDAGTSVVIDRMTVDPLTPGIVAQVYYSSDDDGPGTDSDSWDGLLWTPVYQQYVLRRRDTYAFPKPITCKWVKIEFTNLQARYYDAGQFALPTTFRKYPQWVLNYFIQVFAGLKLDLVSSAVTVVYDLLDLAFTAYEGDTVSTPDAPALSTAQPNVNNSLAFLQGDQADARSTSQISASFQPYTRQPSSQGSSSSLLNRAALLTSTRSYSVENPQTATANTTLVSNSHRESLLVEKGFPNMFFYLPCRHGYRVSLSVFEKNVGYFAGISTIAFHRDVYSGRMDQDQYIEVLGDTVNVQISDITDYAAYAPSAR